MRLASLAGGLGLAGHTLLQLWTNHHPLLATAASVTLAALAWAITRHAPPHSGGGSARPYAANGEDGPE